MKRRDLLKAGATLIAAGWPGMPLLAASAAGTTHTTGTTGTTDPAAAPLHFLPHAEPFDYATLKGLARHLSAQDYQAPAEDLPDALKALDWYRYQDIRFRDDAALWGPQQLAASRFRVKLFHPGHLFRTPVRIYEVVRGKARELAYDPAMFDYGNSGLDAAALPADIGFAGFRILVKPEWQRDVTSFLGASYFRAVGDRYQFGMSARGLAVDCGLARAEEFPRFSRFWLERPAVGGDTLTLYALLESPSISGAYRFNVHYQGKRQIMDVDAALYPRKEIERLGIAPLTSMFWYGENDRRAQGEASGDWRPEIHDSDGLSMWRGNGEWIWRPLANPVRPRFNAYADENPRGFGLLQRDRNFDHYQDDSMFYESRPNLWVEPKGNWGKGSVQLVELSTHDETFDNIVAFWHPDRKPAPGEELLYAYRLHWSGGPEAGVAGGVGAGTKATSAPPTMQAPLARVVATHTGPGGLIGQNIVGRRRDFASWRYIVDFSGDSLSHTAAPLHPVITLSRGETDLVSLHRIENNGHWRVSFDLKPDTPSGAAAEPINLRLHLRDGNRVVSETWMYQWSPPG